MEFLYESHFRACNKTSRLPADRLGVRGISHMAQWNGELRLRAICANGVTILPLRAPVVSKPKSAKAHRAVNGLLPGKAAAAASSRSSRRSRCTTDYLQRTV